MPQSSFLCLTLLLLWLPPQQFPPMTTNPSSAHPHEERPLPIDQPEVITKGNEHRHVDGAQLLREAKELAKLAGEVPPLVEQANKGLLSKDLNDRLKRIEKLSKQLHRDLTQ
jgi:hypothetical protein